MSKEMLGWQLFCEKVTQHQQQQQQQQQQRKLEFPIYPGKKGLDIN